MKRLDIAETLAEAMEHRPALGSLIGALRPLMVLKAALPARLAETLEQSGFTLPPWEEDKAQQGEPLLAGVDLAPLELPLRDAARALLPELIKMEALIPSAPALESFFFAEGQAVRAAQAFMAADGDALKNMAQEVGMPSPVLAFVLELVLGSVFRAVVLREYPSAFDTLGPASPWDERPASWMFGWCPVCGSAPSVGYLEEKVFDQKNAFAAGGGGKKHLHCGLCGTEWHFRRGACPECGKEGADTLEILRESEGSRGERLEWCTHCQSYCPTVDLRERDSRPDMDGQALSMVHLDIAAAEKGLHPLYPSFWNQF